MKYGGSDCCRYYSERKLADVNCGDPESPKYSNSWTSNQTSVTHWVLLVRLGWNKSLANSWAPTPPLLACGASPFGGSRQSDFFRDPRGWIMPSVRPQASCLRQVESYLKDTGMVALASAWVVDRRRPREYRPRWTRRRAAPAYAIILDLIWRDEFWFFAQSDNYPKAVITYYFPALKVFLFMIIICMVCQFIPPWRIIAFPQWCEMADRVVRVNCCFHGQSRTTKHAHEQKC